MFRGPSFIVSTMQEETTPIFKRLWYDWTQQQPGMEPTNPLGQCWVPPIVAFYDQQGLLRTYSLPGSSIRSPHPGSPRVEIQWLKITRANSKTVLLADFYKPPMGKVEQAVKLLEQGLLSLSSPNYEVVILGDFNVDYKNKKSPNFKKIKFF